MDYSHFYELTITGIGHDWNKISDPFIHTHVCKKCGIYAVYQSGKMKCDRYQGYNKTCDEIIMKDILK